MAAAEVDNQAKPVALRTSFAATFWWFTADGRLWKWSEGNEPNREAVEHYSPGQAQRRPGLAIQEAW
jgi:hypothetical protein